MKYASHTVGPARQHGLLKQLLLAAWLLVAAVPRLTTAETGPLPPPGNPPPGADSTSPAALVSVTNPPPAAASIPVEDLDKLATLVGGKGSNSEVSVTDALWQVNTNLTDLEAVKNYQPAAEVQLKLDLARAQRSEKNPELAGQMLIRILETNSPPQFKRLALFELALAMQDGRQFVKAQQIFAQYLHLYPDDPSVPDVLIRQGLLYRQMGVTSMAVSKFYAVMSAALKLKVENMDYYKKLVMQAQMEIADTYYLEGKYADAADFFSRLVKSEGAEMNLPQIQFKLIRSLSYLTNYAETAGKGLVFVGTYTNSADLPEVRFLLASALKKLGRNQDSLRQVLLLLQSQEENARKNPEVWSYWQQRAGNDIANQFFKEGDYLSALQIYLGLADFNKSPDWQLSARYEAALTYEQLQQWQKATDLYGQIIARQKELTPAEISPSLASLFDMAKWRKDYVAWLEKARASNQAFQRSGTEKLSAATP